MNFVKALRLPHASSLQVLNDHSFSGFFKARCGERVVLQEPRFQSDKRQKLSFE
jgi:hypothetical protein